MQKEDHSVKNRLALEKSPYLLQHADNPVDWYPWGEEAFEKAAAEDKPIFLSIGYSTCHWCHVMEHESFEDPEVGRLMNETFVSIKVDREERPDIDGVYMKVSQMMTGRGGWPLTIFMTPEKKPFFAATYIPKESRSNMMGLVDLIARVDELWENERDKILQSADSFTRELAASSDFEPGNSLGPDILQKGYAQLLSMHDEEYGGFGRAPKFPSPHNLLFLLRYWKQTGDEKALEMTLTTLQAMRKGGIHDHIGGGFHRYSTDRVWLTPHFEKMLYDQALIAMAYTEAYAATGNQELESAVQDTLGYVLRDMRSPEGGFYTAEDADSEGEEGKFYLWSYRELQDILSEDELAYLETRFDVSAGGNAKDEATGLARGLNILAEREEFTFSGTDRTFEKVRDVLYKVREKREHPLKDTKILTDWNGLMIAALAKAARTFSDDVYSQAAQQAADFILAYMASEDGSLYHRYKEGSAGITGHLDDYTYLSWGLLELYETTYNPVYLQKAFYLMEYALTHFWDSDEYGFFFTSDLGEELLVREKEIFDGAIPSGNSVAMYVLLKLARMTGETDLEITADKIGRAFSKPVSQSPAGYSFLLSGLSLVHGGAKEIVVIGKSGAPDTDALLDIMRKGYYPEAVVLFIPEGEHGEEIRRLAPYTAGFTSLDGDATVFVCSNYSCQLPTSDPDQMKKLLSDT